MRRKATVPRSKPLPSADHKTADPPETAAEHEVRLWLEQIVRNGERSTSPPADPAENDRC